MLVLTRKVNQSIMIQSPSGGEIEVVVTEIRGDSLRLGIKAPQNVTVDRMEIWLEKQKSGIDGKK